MTAWKNDKDFSDAFIPEIKQILGGYLIAESPAVEDRERNTDLIVLRLEAVRIACRIRKPGYLGAYGHEFTIREGRPGGQKTELTKIVEGWGDYMFYGHSDDAGCSLRAWALIDLMAFRLWFMRGVANLDRDRLPGKRKNNADQSSWFRAFDLRDMPEAIVASKGVPTKHQREVVV